MYVNFIHLMMHKKIMRHLREVPFISHNVFEFFYMFLCTDCLFDIHRWSQLTSPHHSRLEYQILDCYYYTFLCDTNNRHNDMQINRKKCNSGNQETSRILGTSQSINEQA